MGVCVIPQNCLKYDSVNISAMLRIISKKSMWEEYYREKRCSKVEFRATFLSIFPLQFKFKTIIFKPFSVINITPIPIRRSSGI